MEIKKIKIKDLKSPEYNPRNIDKVTFEHLKNSIQNFGYVEPVIYNKKTKNVVGGNQRLAALTSIYGSEEEIEAVVVDLDANQEKALNLALNKITGDWDTAKLANLLENLKAENYNIDITGFSELEMNNILLDNDKFIRPDFDSLIDQFKPKEDTTFKNENWFYIEFYKDDKKFEELKKLLPLIKNTTHEVDPQWFYDLVKNDKRLEE